MWNDDPPHGRAVAKGLEPRSAARRKVSTKLLEILHFFLVFNVQPQLGNTATCDICDATLALRVSTFLTCGRRKSIFF